VAPGWWGQEAAATVELHSKAQVCALRENVQQSNRWKPLATGSCRHKQIWLPCSSQAQQALPRIR